MFTKYENSAEVDIEEVYKYENGAEQEADAVYAYKNDAEVEVWNARQQMSAYFKDEGREYNRTVNSNQSASYEIYGGTANYMYIETPFGDYLNPTFSFTYNGGAWTGSTYIIAGTVYVYGIDWENNETSKMVGNLGTDGMLSYNAIDTTLSGEFAFVGIKVYLKDSTSYGQLYYVDLTLSDIVINGKKYIA